VILDLAAPDAPDGGTVYHWDPDPTAATELVVLWEAARCPADFVDTVENVACVAVPPGYKEFRYPLDAGGEEGVQSWRGQRHGGTLMLIAIPPLKYALTVEEGSDWPTKAKMAGDRMAVYWIFSGPDDTVEPTWKLSHADEVATLVNCCAAINQRPSPPSPPEPTVPGDSQRREWAEQQAQPVEGPPPADS